MTSGNPKALTEAQDDSEPFEVMENPPSNFDLFSSRPVSTCVVQNRKLVHEERKWHSSVHIWIVDAQRHLILVQKRSALKDTFPNRWDISAAGHIPAKAHSVATARAELEEELGVIVTNDDELVFQFICPAEQAPLGGCNCYEHVFFLKKDSTTLKCALGTKEVTEVTWVSIATLKAAWESGDTLYVPRVEKYRDAFFRCIYGILEEKSID